jgi:hypothetical protein
MMKCYWLMMHAASMSIIALFLSEFAEDGAAANTGNVPA